MAPLTGSARELFGAGVRSVMETWPVLQIAVDNGFGGAYGQQKAAWMAEVLQQFFQENEQLQRDEVEDFISELMNNEFDTVVEDGSLPQVAQKLCEMFQQCQQGRLTEVTEQTSLMLQKKSSGRAKATPIDDDEEESPGEEAMECEGGGASVEKLTPQAEEDEEDEGWTVVRRK